MYVCKCRYARPVASGLAGLVLSFSGSVNFAKESTYSNRAVSVVHE